MRNFAGGVIVGVLFSASLGLAGGMYDSKGQPAAPRGSVQQFDYYRQRGQQLDIQHMRQQADRERAEHKIGKPCRD